MNFLSAPVRLARVIRAGVAVIAILYAAFVTAASAAAATGWQPQRGKAIAKTSADAIACQSSTDCEGVGSVRGAVYAAHWNGKRWIRQYTPSPWDSSLADVSCLSLRFCVGVGQQRDSAGVLVESFTGRHWRIDAAPTEQSWHLDGGVSCASRRFCVAVGRRNAPPLTHRPTGSLIEQWNGAQWHRVLAPSRPGDYLIKIDCPSRRFCMAVGAGENLSRPIAEIWNGSSWRRVTAPGPKGYWLNGVSCPRKTSCMAAGKQENDLRKPLLIDRWHGGRWSRVRVPGRGDLTDVSCSSVDHCVADGESFVSGDGSYPGLITTWDGMAWSTELIAVENGYDGAMGGISCPSASFCLALGGGPSGPYVWRR